MMENEYTESERKKRFGEFIECIRYTYGINQVNFAKILNATQSSISKIESGDLTLTAFQWCDLAQNLELPIETIKNCYLDNRTPTIINSTQEENGYLVPRRYSENKCIKIRYLIPFIRFMDFKIGARFFDSVLEDFSKESKNTKATFFRRSFFCNLDNQVNLLFLENLIAKIKSARPNEVSSEEISYFSRFNSSHGFLAKIYEKESSQIVILKNFIENRGEYHGLMMNEIIGQTEDSLTFSSTLNESLFESYYSRSESFKEFTEMMFEKEIQDVSLINISSEHYSSPVMVKKYGAWDKRNDKVIFEIRQLDSF